MSILGIALVYFLFMPASPLLDTALDGTVWSAKSLGEALSSGENPPSQRSVLRALSEFFGDEVVHSIGDVVNPENLPINHLIVEPLREWAQSKRRPVEILQLMERRGKTLAILSNLAGRVLWVACETHSDESVLEAVTQLLDARGGDIAVLPHGKARGYLDQLDLPATVLNLSSLLPPSPFVPTMGSANTPVAQRSHLDQLERESIEIIREAFAASSHPAMLFSMGKDSMVMLSLALKAFAPEPLPFPLVVIDTQWKFQDMYRFREYLQSREDMSVIVYVNPEAIERGMNPFEFGSAVHTDVTKTQALRKVLDEHDFDFVFGGARRDEEKSRAKERIFSIRSAAHGWDPKNQRPELWNLYNTTLVEGQKMRVFPLSNWTEIDIWRYVEQENIDLVPLYLSQLRPYVLRNGSLIMVDDARFPLEPEEKIHFDFLRFRTLGCYPLTGGALSEAVSVGDIISELENSRVSERSSRVIDFDAGASMEQKKKDGYF
mgnify:FL=1